MKNQALVNRCAGKPVSRLRQSSTVILSEAKNLNVEILRAGVYTRAKRSGPQNDNRHTGTPAHRHTRPGFTLIELMIVVIIIAALAAMIVPRLSGRADQAKSTVAQSDINGSLATALKLYQLDSGNFPSTEQGLAALMAKPVGDPAPANWNGPYIEKNPIDPWGNVYRYKSPGDNNRSGYDLYSTGKDAVEGTEDDVTNWK